MASGDDDYEVARVSYYFYVKKNLYYILLALSQYFHLLI